MRYYFIPLAVALGLAGCGQDPTGPATLVTPVTPPNVDVGHNHPSPEVPGACLNTTPVRGKAKTGFAAAVAIPPCAEP
jgi:hypothetical protein